MPWSDLKKAELRALATREIKTNRYDPAADKLLFTPAQAEAFAALQGYYTALFRDGNDRMGLQPGIVKTDAEGHNLTSFFAWLAWAAGTNRLGDNVTYTTNWPFDPLVGNQPVAGTLIWSIVSVIILILFLGRRDIPLRALHARRRTTRRSSCTKFGEPKPTGSQKTTLAYFITAMALFVLQVVLGALTAHYTVEGATFLGVPIQKILPYAAVRTWHLQLAIFWIATCFLATGLFIGPFVGKEPKRQATLSLALFLAVVIVVLGSLAGTWLSVQGRFGSNGFLFGHQGYEYIELGRVWQILLIVGMIIWLVLVVRAIRPALPGEKDNGGLTHVLLYSAVAIPLFYMAGLLYGRSSDLSDAEYWRWWVVHLWVEGFFEVFATVVLAFILSRIGAVSAEVRPEGRLRQHLPLPGGRGDRHVPSPLLDRHADTHHRAGRRVLRAGDRSAGAARFRDGAEPENAEDGGQQLRVQVAGVLLHRRGVLERRGRGRVRVPDQPADRPVLRAGHEHHSAARAHGALRGLRHPRHRSHALLRAPHRADQGVVERTAEMGVLASERRPAGHDAPQPSPVRILPALLRHHVRRLVRAKPRDHLGPVIKLLNYLRILPDTIFGIGGLVIFVFIVRATWMTFARKKA